MSKRTFRRGDPVVVCRMKHKTHPGRHARDLRPAAHGEDYSYYVQKFWIVADVLANGRLLLQTPRGNEHLFDAGDPNLRHASWFERLLYYRRFPRIEAPGEAV